MELKQSALKLAGMGLRVFPLRPWEKRPAIAEWHIQATSDVPTIEAWWAENPQYNIGVCTTGMVGFDLDVKHVGGEVFDTYTKMGGHFDTFTVLTPTGGYHCYFTGPNSKNSVNVKPGIDIRSHNGFLVAPGSIIDPVRAGNPELTAGEYTIINDIEIAKVPEKLLRILREPREVKSGNALAEAVTKFDSPAVKAAINWLVNEAKPSVEGLGGNDTAYAVAAAIVNDYGIEPDLALDIMLGTWNLRCSPPWTDVELGRIIENAANYSTGNKGYRNPETYFSETDIIQPGQPIVHPKQEDAFLEEALVSETANAWLEGDFGNIPNIDDIPERKWIVERLFMRSQVTMIGGSGGAGKSALFLTIIAHLASGKPFGPYKLFREGKPLRFVVYNAEDDIMEQSRRIHGVCIAHGLDFDEVKKNIRILDSDMFGGHLTLAAGGKGKTILVNEKKIEEIRNFITENGVDVFIFDPFVNLHGCDENDNIDMRGVMEVFNKLARDTDSAITIVHHSGKGAGNKAKGDAEVFRGASSIINRSRIALLVSNALEDEYKRFGVNPGKGQISRVDDAKANLFMKVDGAVLYAEWKSVHIKFRDYVGAPMLLDINEADQYRKRSIANIIYKYMMNVAHAATISPLEAARILIEEHDPDENSSETALKRELESMFRNPVRIEGEGCSLVYSIAEGDKSPTIHIMGNSDKVSPLKDINAPRVKTQEEIDFDDLFS